MADEQEWINYRLIEMATKYDYGEGKSYLPIPHVLRKCSKLSSTEKDVLYHLLYSMNDKKYCFPAYGTIAAELFIGVSTVVRAIDKLEQMYFIKKEEFIGSSNRYYIDMLEDNPYLILSGYTSHFKRSFQPIGVAKGLCKNKVIKQVNKFVEKEDYDVFAHRFYSGEDTEIVLIQFLEQLRKYVEENTNIKIRPIGV
ncbi:helix-turn-helix domain-containing protein [Paenibacillus xerothermodurans]|nr:helix-turn-helix domain-containing protein [Paenibacillus xerothermodurans]